MIVCRWQQLRHRDVASAGRRRRIRAASPLNVAIAFTGGGLGTAFGKVRHAPLPPTVVATTFILRRLRDPVGQAPRVQSRIESVSRMTPWDALKGRQCSVSRSDPSAAAQAPPSSAACCWAWFRKAPDFSFFPGDPDADRVRRRLAASTKERALLAAATSRCSPWGCCCPSPVRGSACAGCCATSPATPSRPSPGTIAFGVLVLVTAHFGWVTWAD